MATKAAKSATLSMPRLKTLYLSEIAPALVKEFNLNPMQAPAMEKIVVSVGLGKDKDNKRMFEIAENTLTKITGQKPVETIAKKSIASFKLREGNRIGLKVTLRGDRMYEFYDRLVNLVIPRLRDFHGVPLKSFDGQANYSIGLKDQSVFHELSFDEISNAHGLEITIVTTTDNKDHSEALLTKLGMPFEKRESK
jgi:large subunit ribosomal protein L5